MMIAALGAGWWFWVATINMYYNYGGPGALGPFETRELCQAAQRAMPHQVNLPDGRKARVDIYFSDCFEAGLPVKR